MANSAPKLNPDQLAILKMWIAAGYSYGMIRSRLERRGWPVISEPAVSQHRTAMRAIVERVKAERHAAAVTSGLALKEERVARLCEYADEVDEIKWVADEKGRLWNGVEWRKALDDIAKEMGDRRAGVDLNVNDLPDEQLRREARETLDGPRASDPDHRDQEGDP